MLAAAALMLLVAIVNVSNLLLVQAASRSQEFALLGALGATPWDLLRQSALPTSAGTPCSSSRSSRLFSCR
jgi:ABC-type antimicrobial peptide transport system permease subunit